MRHPFCDLAPCISVVPVTCFTGDLSHRTKDTGIMNVHLKLVKNNYFSVIFITGKDSLCRSPKAWNSFTELVNKILRNS